MSLSDYAKNSQFVEELEQLFADESLAMQRYFILAWIAQDKGLDELSHALLKNAFNAAMQIGKFGGLLGKAPSNDMEFAREIYELHRQQKDLVTSLNQLADKVNSSGEIVLGKCLMNTAEQENICSINFELFIKSHKSDTSDAAASSAKIIKFPDQRNNKKSTFATGSLNVPFLASEPTGEGIRGLRQQAKMTEKEFAQFLGISVATVRRWEAKNGKFPIKLKNISPLIRLQQYVIKNCQ